MNFVTFKYDKAIFDLQRIHGLMLEASQAIRSNPANAATPSHSAWGPLTHTLTHGRYIVDDLLSDLGNCWDVFLNESLAAKHVPTDGPRPNGGSIHARSDP